MIKASIITIGDELLIGQVTDTNSVWMAQQLNEIGIDIVGKYTVGVEKGKMLNLLSYVGQSSDIILMTGGLGPTQDDITTKVLAEFFGDELAFSQVTYDKIVEMFASRDREPGEAHRQQCFLPKSARLFQNSQGTAPAMLMKKEGLTLVSMPGVPYEMKSLMIEHILPYIKQNFDSEVILHKTICTGGIGESSLAELISDIEMDLPSHITLAYLPSLGNVRLRLTAKGNDKSLLEKELKTFEGRISDRISDNIWGYDEDTLVSVIADICNQKNIKLGLAESCTGGNVARNVVLMAGSSSFFEGGVVSYSNHLKNKILGVSQETLNQYGAVSEETVKEMAVGAVETLDVNVAASISGIAGPSGGTPEKPVGTIWLAVSDGQNTETHLIKGVKNRKNNIEYATNRILYMAYSFLKKI